MAFSTRTTAGILADEVSKIMTSATLTLPAIDNASFNRLIELMEVSESELRTIADLDNDPIAGPAIRAAFPSVTIAIGYFYDALAKPNELAILNGAFVAQSYLDAGISLLLAGIGDLDTVPLFGFIP